MRALAVAGSLLRRGGVEGCARVVSTALLESIARSRPASTSSRVADDDDGDAHRTPLLGLGVDALTKLAKEHGQPGYRGKQLHDAVYSHRKEAIEAITQIPEAFRSSLRASGVHVGRVRPIDVVAAPDGTKKVLLKLRCGSVIEAVGIPEEMNDAKTLRDADEGYALYEDGDEHDDDDDDDDGEDEDEDDGEDAVDLDDAADEDGWVRLGRLKVQRDERMKAAARLKKKERREELEAAAKAKAASGGGDGGGEKFGETRRRRFTVCVSSQVGCAMRCSFCATGRQGFKRNLTSDEIVNQVLALEDVFGRRATNVVMMGMGEPLMNLKEVLRAHRCLNRDVGIGGRYFTISTVGVPNQLSKLAAHKLQATLAVSLHAPTQELREKLIPSAKAYHVDDLLEDCRLYKKSTGKRLTFEYTLLAGENDSPEHARALGRLLRTRVGRGSHVNLLPWNPVTGAEDAHARPSKTAVKRFADALAKERGVTFTVRRTRGLEADAACGQLTGSFVRKGREAGVAV
tara:strand:+ start:2040 stop:3587 length:1548 start_codon:yes stop_codon:yes gene_type:complete